MHGSMPKSAAAKFEDYLCKDNALIIGNFRVIEKQNIYYCPIPFRYNIDLRATTEIQKLAQCVTFPSPKFYFAPFAELRKRVDSATFLSDVIGNCIKVTDLGTSRSGIAKKEMLIPSDRDEEVIVTIWNNIATNLPSCLTDPTKRTIVILAAVIVKNDNGMVALATTKDTRIYINLDIPEANALQKKLQAPPTRKRTLIPAVDPKPLSYVKQILSQNAGITIICRAKIIAVYHDEGWSYLVCPACGKKANLNNGRY